MPHKSLRHFPNQHVFHGKRGKTFQKEKVKTVRIGNNEIVEHQVTVVETPRQKLERYRKEQLAAAVNKTVDEVLNVPTYDFASDIETLLRKEGGDAQQ